MVDNGERYWEAIDLISKALTSHDGPFSWEGKHFTHRHVNIWPPAFPAAAAAHVVGHR
jgi:alkanesulfonate monooxygenase SsuD/methylene tetrahydromethanopterin reductase-like flavin-dependent oxidoreductase (luciferase family)